MKNSGLISIVITCYNDAEYIEQAVFSALNQTYLNKEVIVVDDGSDVSTKIVLKSLENNITKLITQENKGQSCARNVGISEAKGEYILVLDSDDFFEPSFCEKALSVFLEKNDVKIVTCQANLLYEDGLVISYTPDGGDISNFIYANGALGSTMFIKSDWKNINGYDEYMRKGFEDWEFYIRVLKNGGCTYVLPEILFTYRKRSDSTTSIANKVKYDLLFYIYTKHKELFINDYENFVSHLLGKIKVEERDKIKYLKKTENKFLNLLRMIKPLFKNSPK
ncbi:glycosyltransferase family A protein [Flavobacterium sp. WC2429]|uniref:Glycosyltransferase family A protein n=1 Tax=Flavobacterium sp. WC2429 TaxID=3234140 RepID=A0AB39WP89_9FLAO